MTETLHFAWIFFCLGLLLISGGIMLRAAIRLFKAIRASRRRQPPGRPQPPGGLMRGKSTSTDSRTRGGFVPLKVDVSQSFSGKKQI